MAAMASHGTGGVEGTYYWGTGRVRRCRAACAFAVAAAGSSVLLPVSRVITAVIVRRRVGVVRGHRSAWLGGDSFNSVSGGDDSVKSVTRSCHEAELWMVSGFQR